jgi:hypothetical protein
MSEPPFLPEWGWDGFLVFVGALAGALASGAVAWWLERTRLKWQAKDARRRIACALDAELELLVQGVEAALKVDDALATITTIATFRNLTTVFVGNANQLGQLEADLVRGTIGAYQNMHHFIDRGHEMWQEAARLPDDHRRASALTQLRDDAKEYIPRVKDWLEATKRVRQQLGQVQ